MTRRRAWEIGATAALLLAMGVAVGGFFAWQERQRRLDREMVALLQLPDPPTQSTSRRALTLVRQGASVHARGVRGVTILMVAGAVNDTVLLREALAHGADVNADDEIGATALMVAASYGHVESVQVLLEHGAEVKRKDKNGLTTLWYAKEHGGPAVIIRLLKQHGAKE